MISFQVFDPPMCCSTGVCGAQVDPVLPRFAEDFHWLANQGIVVERYNLAQQPQAFVGDPTVKSVLAKEGTACLPLILVNGDIVSKGRYPERAELSRFVGLSAANEPVLAIITDGACKSGSGCC